MDKWLQQYATLAFRISRVTCSRYQISYVSDYYGPAAWQQAIASEAEMQPDDLVRKALTLEDALLLQGFAPQRKQYLERQLLAMETVCRKLSGERFPLVEEMKRCFDIRVGWISETEFERAHTLYESSLPGTDSLIERKRAYEQLIRLPEQHTHTLPDIVTSALAETRRRTKALVRLPQEEDITIRWSTDRGSEAHAEYNGNYHSYMAIDPKGAAYHLPRLLDHIICHEGYPGHHTEFVLKEQQLYRQQGWIEPSIFLYVSPRCVISEGIAMMAHQMIFLPGEAEQWMATQVYAKLNMEVDPHRIWQLRQASEQLTGVWINAAFLLDEGRTEEEVIRYFAKYMVQEEQTAAACIKALRDPLIGHYLLIYYYGQQLMTSCLQEQDRQMVFQRWLTEQITPSQLAEELNSSS